MTYQLTRRAFATGLPVSSALLASRTATGQDRPAAAVSSGNFSAYIYRVGPGADLVWQRHDAATRGDDADVPGAWTDTRGVGTGWGAPRVFSGGGTTIYLIDKEGDLRWYRHDGYRTGAGLGVEGAWSPLGSTRVGNGWGGLQHVFSGGHGIIYTITASGVLNWYRHYGYQSGTGTATPGAWATPMPVNKGWQNLSHVFSGGDGVIYTVAQDGTLWWHRHNNFQNGGGGDSPGAWDGPKAVSSGWAAATHVFSPGLGIIYSIAADGTLEWFRHNGFRSGDAIDKPGAWSGPREAGRGWSGLQHVFALLPPHV